MMSGGALVLALSAAPWPAAAVGRVVVVPTVIGGGAAADSVPAGLVPALADGLGDNRKWEVVHGPSAHALIEGGAAAPATSADWERLAEQLDRAARLAPGPGAGAGAADALAAVEPLRQEIQRAFEAGPWSQRGADALYRAGGTLAAALVASGDTERARSVAAETALLFPGRRPGDRDRLSAEATGLLGAAQLPSTAVLSLVSRPEGCELSVNGTGVGRAPIELPVLAGQAYYAWARCPGPAPIETRPRRLVAAPQAAARIDVLDAEFARALECGTPGCRLRFSSGDERKRLEETYARRAAESFDAQAVVFASVGELGGTDWIYARLYRNNGLLVRQALARVEPTRARALGSYLATGKDTSGVLRHDDAAALAFAARDLAREPPPPPWYTDALGWTLGGVGVAALGAGLVLRSMAADRSAESDMIGYRGDQQRRQELLREAGDLELGSFFALGVGATLAVTGVIILVIPEGAVRGELMSVAPTRGGAFAAWTARF